MEKDKSSYNQDEFLEAARKLTRRIRKADEVDELDIDNSFRIVMSEVKEIRSRSTLRQLYWWVASSAALIGIILAMTWWNKKEVAYSGLDIALLNDTISISQGEVTLITGSQAVNLKNESFLKYDTSGSLNVRQYVLANQTAQVAIPKNKIHTLVVPVGRRADIIFSDGTKIYINSGSKVVYPDVFDKDKREILVEGEAYLDVVKNPERPFIVKTKGFDIRVLGTSFNICAYNEEPSASVVLVQGNVIVTTENKQEVQLKPNQIVDIEGNKTSVRQVDVSEYISWKDNMLQVNRKLLVDVFKKLELYYGYKIHCDPSVASKSLTGKLDLLSTIEEVMDNLSLSFPIHYTVGQSKEIYVSLK